MSLQMMSQLREWRIVASVLCVLSVLSFRSFLSAAEPPAAGLALWLKADAVTGIATGSPLAAWPDSSGHNRAAAQAAAEQQPRWVADGFNGKPAVRFSGKEWLDTPQDIVLPAAHSYFAVIKDRTTDENGVFLWFENEKGMSGQPGDADGPAYGTGGFGKNFRLRNYPGMLQRGITPGPAAVFELVAAPDGVYGWINGLAWLGPLKNEWTGAFKSGNKTGRFRLGRHGGKVPQFFAGEMAELLVYDRALGEVERRAVEDYLGAKWGIPVRPAMLVTNAATGMVTLGNEYLVLTVNGKSGARGDDFRIPGTAGNWVPPSGYGLFVDRIWGGPDEFIWAPYDAEVLASGPDTVAVRFSRLSEGRRDATKTADPRLSKLRLEKTLTVKAGVPGVFCRVKFKNTDTVAKLFAYWQQHIVFPLGTATQERTVMLRPSRRGVRILKADGREHYIKDVTAGWTAILDQPQRTGVAFLLDYNKLGFLYNAASAYTTEWVAEDTYMPAGQEWEVESVAVPFRGLGGLQHASSNFLADLQVERTGNRLKLNFALARSVTPVAGVRLSGEIYSVTDQKAVPFPETAVGAPAAEPVTATVAVVAPGQDPLVIRVKAVCATPQGEVTNRFETFYIGAYRWGDNITLDMVTPAYVGQAPAKRRTLLRPPNLGHPVCNEIYLMQGLMTDRWRLDQFWIQLVPWTKYRRSYYSNGFGVGGKVLDFPYDYDELLRKQVIIMVNVQASGLGFAGMQMLRDYVAVGGALWIFGGHVAYGAGGWAGSPLEEVLPVRTLGRPFDVRKAKNTRLQPGPNPDGLLLDVELTDQPRCYYYHEVEPKPGSLVPLVVDGTHPFIVAGRFEKGYVVCFTGTPIGEPLRGDVPFWEWNNWATVMRNAFYWSAHRGSGLK
ncbi:MAG: hypothetical protein KKF10_02945 [Verrucomicrobia bacterium]|nr:hypothetical protein [Verrucomicrobiota bacterium]